MKLVVKIKLIPSEEQSSQLMQTLTAMNEACNYASSWAFNAQAFDRYSIHKNCYEDIRKHFHLYSQMAIRCVAKVVHAYKVKAGKCPKGNYDTKRTFKPKGATSFDARNLSFKMADEMLSISTIAGRAKMPFKIGAHSREMLKFQKGESDLFLSKGDFFLNVCSGKFQKRN